MNINDNNELIEFLKILLQNEIINEKAPELIKFFIITRNYGLINLQDNIKSIYQNENLENLITKAIMDGFKKDNIPYTAESILYFLINNYHENGFYYYEENSPKNKIITDYIGNNSNNSQVRLGLIPKKNSEKYFGKYISLENVNALLEFTSSCKMSDKDIINFITNVLSHNEINTEKIIKEEDITILEYKVKEKRKTL